MANIEDATVAMDGLSLEDIATKHRRERKELQAKIQELKKSAPKSDKKKRKEAKEAMARLESEMENRHEDELKAAQKAKNNNSTPTTTKSEEAVAVNGTLVEENNAPQRVSKAQKRRDKKAREARERQEEIIALAKEQQFDPKTTELSILEVKLKERSLVLHHVASDGDCMYNAVRHQLQMHNFGTFSVPELRKATADYIRANKDALLFYMIHPDTGEELNDNDFEKYCNAVESTAAWGGHIELKALSAVLKTTIEVLQAEGPPTIQGSGEFCGPNVVITYHRHMYSMGEHYNSTKPLTEVVLPEIADTDTDTALN